jgi:CRP-like cAMP-binding protein
VTQDGRVLRREGPGEYFGEIALLRDVPRTATITALEDTVVRTIAREDFLEVVSGNGEARSAAEATVSSRLAV